MSHRFLMSVVKFKHQRFKVTNHDKKLSLSRFHPMDLVYAIISLRIIFWSSGVVSLPTLKISQGAQEMVVMGGFQF